MGLVDRVVVMDVGAPIAPGRPEAVCRDPVLIEACPGGMEGLAGPDDAAAA